MFRIWMLIGLMIFSILLTMLFMCFFNVNNNDSFMLISDELNPMYNILNLLSYDMNILKVNPYQFSRKLPGYKGMALVYETQAYAFSNINASAKYIPLYSSKIVMAVNKSYNFENHIEGWSSLMKSDARICVPYYNTEEGRLSAIALAIGLGAKEGDIGPAIKAYNHLKSENRLNEYSVYKSDKYQFMYNTNKVIDYDVVILWDYQANMLNQIFGGWDIINPTEGTIIVNSGLQYSNNILKNGLIQKQIEFLTSPYGQQLIRTAGFSEIEKNTDLTAWNKSRLFFGPAYRRAILEQKQFGPASVYERIYLQSIILLLFCVASHIVLHRHSKGEYRNSSYFALSLIFIWMFIEILKTLSLSDDLNRYLWFASYIPRHALPLSWYLMCCVAKQGKNPSKKLVYILFSIMILLNIGVLSNDIHRLFFYYLDDISSNWILRYKYNWGYYFSFIWSIVLVFAGSMELVRQKKNRQQKRQLIIASIFFASLIAYQIMYVAGVKYVMELDVSTTVAITVLLFVFAAQNERFLGAKLLSLPVFYNSPYALAVMDNENNLIYDNNAMKEILEKDIDMGAFFNKQNIDMIEFFVEDYAYAVKKYIYGNSKAIAFEEITHIKKTEKELEQTKLRLEAATVILTQHSMDAFYMAEKEEKEVYINKMNQLFISKLSEIQDYLSGREPESLQNDSYSVLIHTRLLLYMCQHRLRFVIRTSDMSSYINAKLIEDYIVGIVNAANRIGLDAAVTSNIYNSCSIRVVQPILETVDRIILYAQFHPDLSLIFHLESDEHRILLNASLTLENSEFKEDKYLIIDERLLEEIRRDKGKVYQNVEEDGITIKISFHSVEGNNI